MPDPNNQQGPWGPFGGSSGPSPKNDAPRPPHSGGTAGGGPNVPPPDFDYFLRKWQSYKGPFKPADHREIIGLAALVLIGLWFLSGFYLVGTDQQGVVMRFGAFQRTEQPGLRYHLPAPIEEVLLPVVTAQNEIPVGMRRVRGTDAVRTIPQESQMLTQDENIIDVQFTVFWRISDVNKFLFEIRDPETTIKMGAESVMREVIGQNKLQFALTDGRGPIADEARTRLQALMDEYNAGIVVSQINLQTVSVPDEVKAAFQDVVNAKLDQERFQNQAAAHVNKVIPDAKGQAAQILQQAMAYRDQKIAAAQGEAERFKEIQPVYAGARDVTAKRLYLETMESVLSHAPKVLMDKGAGTAALPYFPLFDKAGKNNDKP